MSEQPDDELRAPLLELLGLAPAFRPEDEWEPVDCLKLEKFCNGELDEAAREEVLASIRLFHNWYQAWVRRVLKTEREE